MFSRGLRGLSVGSAKIAAALLAAGSSRRLGQPKQLLTMRGRPLIRHAFDQLSSSPCAPLAVVLGARAAEVEDALDLRAHPRRATTVLHNHAHREGLSSSLRVAVAWASQLEVDALLICVCDQPALSADHLTTLCAVFLRSRARGRASSPYSTRAVASRYNGKLGVPAVFGRGWFARLSLLTGDRGAGSLLRADASVVAVDWPLGAFDVDTTADLPLLNAHSLRPRLPPAR